MSFDLTGPERKELREILLTAFDRRGLKKALAESAPARDLDSLVPDTTFESQVFEMIAVAEREGWLWQIATLLEQERPNRPDLLVKARDIIECPSPTPAYLDGTSRELAEALERAQLYHEQLTLTGQDPAPALEKILDIKRRMREGGKLQPGDSLSAGRFRLLELIGQGGFAQVFKAYDRQTRRLVAVKVLHGQYAHDRSRRARFFRGARKMADLQHQCIVQVIEPKLEDEGYYYFVMELAEGGDFRQAVLGGKLNLDQKLQILQATGQALDYAHSSGIIHRDVKPANILLDATNQPKLTDFDLVRAQDSTGGTRTGMLGTIIYAAPEALERAKDADIRADVFGLGMTSIFALSGRDLPARELLRNAPGFARRLPAPETIRAALARAVAWEPEKRQASVAELCAELQPRDVGADPAAPQRSRTPPKPVRTTYSGPATSTAKNIHDQLDRAKHWEERVKIFSQIPEAVGDAAASLEMIIRLQARTSDTHDLFFLDQLVQDVRQRWPDSALAAESVSRRLYANRGTPPEGVFTQVETPRDGPRELWRKIEAGSFLMDSSNSEPGRDQDLFRASNDRRLPYHVHFSQPFMLMAVPVTNAMYRAFDPSHKVEEWPGFRASELDDHPVVNVDWYQASVFCRWLSFHGFDGARLPFQTEWEYACRAGTSSRFWNGHTDTDLERIAWYESNSGSRTHRVGKKQKSPWGLYDMHGNVWEWCIDTVEESAMIDVLEPAMIDPSTNTDVWNTKTSRILRGGSWAFPTQLTREDDRRWNWLRDKFRDVGFRVCALWAPSR